MVNHSFGTKPSTSDFKDSSSGAESKISPFIAFFNSFKEVLMILMRPLNLISSWVKTVFKLCSYLTGYFSSADLKSYCSGKSFKIELAKLVILASVSESPDAPADYWVVRIAIKVSLVSFKFLVIAAF